MTKRQGGAEKDSDGNDDGGTSSSKNSGYRQDSPN